MRDDEDMRVSQVLTLCWVLFWIYWLFAASEAKASRKRSWWGAFAGARVALVVVVIFVLRDLGVGGHDTRPGPAATAIGLVLFAAGLGLAIWARVYLGRNWGMPMTQREEPELVTTGPYKKIRHPIYAGMFLGVLGTALATTVYGLIVVAVLAGYFIVSATREEAFLAQEFPDSYPAYKRSTKMLIPFLF
jgi:protein-S-isoprenylcysteine O-methyltransferase Ste14